MLERIKIMKSLQVQAISTSIFSLNENLLNFIITHISDLKENDILAITSKIVSLSEGAVVDPDTIKKKELVKQQADFYLGEIGYDCFLTIKHGLLIPSAGIDESNSENNNFILFPIDPYKSALQLWTQLKNHYKINNLGIIITDSRTSPLRVGVTGVCLSYAGIKPVANLIGKKDIFGRKLKMTQINNIDAIASAAVWCMGESDECTPLALIKTKDIDFTDQINPCEICMDLENDLYSPILMRSLVKHK